MSEHNNKQILRHITSSLDVIDRINQITLVKENRSPTSKGWWYKKHWIRIQLPYLVDENGYVLNRDYKPLGLVSGVDFDNVDYKDYPCLSETNNDERFVYENIHGRKYLYTEGNQPYKSESDFKAYRERLELLIACLEENIPNEQEVA